MNAENNMIKFIWLVVLLVSFKITFSNGIKSDKHAVIFVMGNATLQTKVAAKELHKYLSNIYPDCQFEVTSKPQNRFPNIFFGLIEDLPVEKSIKDKTPVNKEGFLILKNNAKQLIICSRSESGLFNATYSLAEKLGYGFYLSSEELVAKKHDFNFNEWDMTGSPLQPERIVFNWHNFLSGCTGWDYEDWCSWIDQSAKMKFNTIMVHAYGNNPMFSFEYNGKVKEVGYLTTSIGGRDWGAQHVKDIRNLPGGEVFNRPVLGSVAANVPDEQRGKAATKLMSRVFEHANEMAMKVNFAIDVDTWSANPVNIIESLPSDSRIKLEKQDVVNPETTQGFQYYKAQVKSLLTDYPHISTITVWVRRDRTLWRDIKPAQFPARWQNEWAQLLLKHPLLGRDEFAASTFAFSKVVISFQKALKEIGRKDVNVAFGSWLYDFLPSASVLMPEDCTLIPLDAHIDFDSVETQKILKEAGSKRKLIPIVWAHHDDHRYMGRPYTPFPNFNNLLKERNANGFGIIHWTTRPLDLYFKNLADQVWDRSENKSISATISDYNRTVFGTQQQALTDYMTEWITGGPMFGRETTEHFFDLGKQQFGKAYEPTTVTLEGIKKRVELLNKVNQAEFSPSGKKVFEYYHLMEQFYQGVFQNQDKFTKAYAMLIRQNSDSAKMILQTATPEKTVETYAKASSILPITPGEKALIVSMSIRWLPDFINLKQRTRMADIYYKFDETQHDSLAQYPGTGTYFIDKEKTLWSCLGEKELKSGIIRTFDKNNIAGLPEESYTYIKTDKPLIFPLVTIGRNTLSPGKYKIELFYAVQTPNEGICNLFLIDKNNRTPLQYEMVKTDSKLKQILAIIEIKDSQKSSIEIDPGIGGKQFTNLTIRPVN